MANRRQAPKRSENAAIVMGCLVVGALGGCSSEGNILPKRERFTSAFVDGGDDAKARDPYANCVKPGTPSNERGVGGYCETSADCAFDGAPRFCSAAFKEIAAVPDDRWFCSTVCTMDEECGSEAICVTNDFSSSCQPVICAGDAGRPPN